MSIFPTKILLATDGSQEAQTAATTAINVANSTHSELHLLTVGSGSPSYDVRIPEVAEELRRQAQQILDEQVKKIEQSGGEVAKVHLRLAEHHPGFEHHPSDDVVREAEAIGAGLIVVGSRGRGGLRRALMGSVSDSVVRHAHCTVMVVRGDPVAFPTKILVATDASEEAHLAATTAADVAERTGSELHLVHVGKVNTRGAYSGVEVGPLPGIHQGELDRQAGGLFEAKVERMESSGTKVAGSHLRRGRADEEIVVSTEEIGADLVVMGSRGLGGIRRALLGSVSDSVVRHAHCPVMVVRADKGRAD